MKETKQLSIRIPVELAEQFQKILDTESYGESTSEKFLHYVEKTIENNQKGITFVNVEEKIKEAETKTEQKLRVEFDKRESSLLTERERKEKMLKEADLKAVGQIEEDWVDWSFLSKYTYKKVEDVCYRFPHEFIKNADEIKIRQCVRCRQIHPLCASSCDALRNEYLTTGTIQNKAKTDPQKQKEKSQQQKLTSHHYDKNGKRIFFLDDKDFGFRIDDGTHAPDQISLEELEAMKKEELRIEEHDTTEDVRLYCFRELNWYARATPKLKEDTCRVCKEVHFHEFYACRGRKTERTRRIEGKPKK